MKLVSPASRTVSALSLIVLAALTFRGSWSPLAWLTMAPATNADERHLAMLDQQPEAREWIRTNGREGPLASNRFEGKEDGLAFVNALYEAGAVKVVVDSIIDDKIEMDEGGPYADALIVRLPADAASRKRLLSIVDSEAKKQGEPVADVGLQTLYFWWD